MPLRERPHLVPYLVNHFLRICSTRNLSNVRSIAKEAMAVLRSYAWPGNIRQLHNVIERITAMGVDEEIQLKLIFYTIISHLQYQK